MNTNIFIPTRINVGFQNRQDTYTKKLAYVIYFDQKGVLRKEKSWEGWRDKEIPNVIYNNEPTSGFVLNKKVGDYSSNWNHRQAYIRIYDPRDFEFEITVENLLYILENTSSIKGKGLEGEFVYGFDGKDLVLLPVDSPDYKEIEEYNKIIHSRTHILAKNLKVGATYKDKNNNDWVYMGRFNYYSPPYRGATNCGLHHFFARLENVRYGREVAPYLNIFIVKSLGDKFISVVSEEPVQNYTEMFELLEREESYSPYDPSKDKYIPYTYDEFFNKVSNRPPYYNDFYTRSNGLVEKIPYVYKDSLTNIYYIETYNNSIFHGRNRTDIGSLENVFERYHPMYKVEYLANGRLRRSNC